MNRPGKLVLLFLMLGIATSAFLLWWRHQAQIRTRTFEFHYVTRIPAAPEQAGKLRLWIPVPESNGQQEISHLTIDSTVPYELHRDPEYDNQYAYLEVDPHLVTIPIEVRMHLQVERREHRVTPEEPARHPNAIQRKPAEMSRFLQPDRLVPIDGMIAALAKKETRGLEQPLDKARAIYNYVVSTVRYDKSGQGWGRGDAIYACNVRKGNCTDFHALLIGMMRAAGIPARFEIGFPIPHNQNTGEIAGYHCWAQFYLEGVGWVPVDASDAWKDPARRNYFFGAHDEHRVLFTRGRDIRFNPAQQGEPLNFFIYPYAEFAGKTFTGVEYQFSFRDLPQ